MYGNPQFCVRYCHPVREHYCAILTFIGIGIPSPSDHYIAGESNASFSLCAPGVPRVIFWFGTIYGGIYCSIQDLLCCVKIGVYVGFWVHRRFWLIWTDRSDRSDRSFQLPTCRGGVHSAWSVCRTDPTQATRPRSRRSYRSLPVVVIIGMDHLLEVCHSVRQYNSV